MVDLPEIGSIAAATPRLYEKPDGESKVSGFGDMLGQMIGETNRAQTVAESSAVSFAKGEGDVVETVLSLNEADLSLRMLLQVRNRVLEAYKEIIRSI